MKLRVLEKIMCQRISWINRYTICKMMSNTFVSSKTPTITGPINSIKELKDILDDKRTIFEMISSWSSEHKWLGSLLSAGIIGLGGIISAFSIIGVIAYALLLALLILISMILSSKNIDDKF